MLDIAIAIPCLSGHHIYYLRLKWFNVNQPGLYIYNAFTRSRTSMYIYAKELKLASITVKNLSQSNQINVL